MAQALRKVVVALDWTPNTNHVGFYLAQQLGLYTAAGLDVELRSPDAPQQQQQQQQQQQPVEGPRMTPARLVASRRADFGIAPSESAISWAVAATAADNDAVQKEPLVAVAALLQGSTSAVCTLHSSGITRPKQLEGKRYATYGGRFEDAIVRRMVENDGGDSGALTFVPMRFHGYHDEVTMRTGSVVRSHLEANQSDATWIFSHVEGVLAKRAGDALNEWKLEEHGIPYGYHPILLARRSDLTEAWARAFMAATAEGYKRAAADPLAAAAAVVACGHSAVSDVEFVQLSAQSLAPAVLTAEGQWGVMEGDKWRRFVDFLVDIEALKDRQGKAIARSAVDDTALWSNALLQ